MSDYEVMFVQTRELRKLVEQKEQFEFRADKKWPRLQRVLFWMLSKLGARAQSEVVTYTRHVVRPEKFMEALYAQQRELITIYHHRGERLLIGPEEYAALFGEADSHQMLSFTAPYGYDRKICGMKVTVVPWMKGMLVMPKDEH